MRRIDNTTKSIMKNVLVMNDKMRRCKEKGTTRSDLGKRQEATDIRYVRRGNNSKI